MLIFHLWSLGARKCNAVEIWDGIARKAGYHFDYINTLMMVDNWLPNFDMNERIKMDKHIPEHLAHGHQAGEQSEVARNRFIL